MFPERELPQGGRAHNSGDRLVEVRADLQVLETLTTKAGWTLKRSCSSDRPVERRPEQYVLQGGRSHDAEDGVIQLTTEASLSCMAQRDWSRGSCGSPVAITTERELFEGRRPRDSCNRLVETRSERQLCQGLRPHDAGDRLVELTPKRQLLQSGRPDHSSDGLVESPPERQPLKGGRPQNFRDGLVKVMAKRQLLNRVRPHDAGDRLVENVPKG